VSHTHDLTEWAAFLSLGTGLTATGWLLWLLVFEPLLECDLDPRPLLARAIHSEAAYPLLREWDTARSASREALRDTAALLLLLTTSPKGTLR